MLQLWHNILLLLAISHEQGPVAQVKSSKEAHLN